MRAAIEGINRGLLQPTISWPARARVFGNWPYALSRAFDEARERHQKVWVYRGNLDGEEVWVVSLDPKKRKG